MSISRRTFLYGLALPGLAYEMMRTQTATADTPFPVMADGLSLVTRFADTLLARGRDNFGTSQTALWVAVMDARDGSVPRGFSADAKAKSNREAITTVPPLPGVREGDRAVGGSNLLHDSITLHLFENLSQISGQARYAQAARDYCHEFLNRAQHPQTGLLAWGEHLFYDVFADKPSVHPYYSQKPLWPHELLADAPPWEMLWQADAQRTARAIDGLRLHFYEDKPGSLFNRHAFWDRAEHQKAGTPGESQPWIKHAGLFAHAFAFGHAHSQNPQQKDNWLDWARGTASIYPNARDPRTGLVESCLTDPRPASRLAGGDMTSLAFSLHRAFLLCPQETQWRQNALDLFMAWEKYAYDAERDVYRDRFPTDGSASNRTTLDATTDGTGKATSWHEGYGDASTLPLRAGRIAAHLARHEHEADCLSAARRIHRVARSTPLDPDASVRILADALHLSLDLHDLTGEAAFLADARFYAGEATARFCRVSEAGTFLVRRAGDPFYEAKAGIGSMACGLLRGHLQSPDRAQSNFPANTPSLNWGF